MSTQSKGINVFHNTPKEGYRILELPPELEAALTGPGASALTLESSGDDTVTILKSPDKSYTLKQKNTSNAIFLLKPSDSPNSPEQGLSTVATIHETIELDPIRSMEANPSLPHTGSKGKWHERFGLNR